MRTQLRDAAVLVLANKQDLPNAASAAEVVEAFGMADCLRGRAWSVQACVATEGDGLYQGLDWLADALHGRPAEGGSKAATSWLA